MSGSNKVAVEYDRQARKFQADHNRTHPGGHIWRHVLYRKKLVFYAGGRQLSLSVKIVRFIHAGTNRTFTFHGTMFLAFFHFTREYMEKAVSDPGCLEALGVDEKTVARWKTATRGCGAPDPGPEATTA